MRISFFKIFGIVAIGHLVLTLVLVLYGFDLNPIDTGVPSPISKQLSSRLASLLMMPTKPNMDSLDE